MVGCAVLLAPHAALSVHFQRVCMLRGTLADDPLACSRSPLERQRPAPSIRIAVSAAHSKEDVAKAIAAIKAAWSGEVKLAPASPPASPLRF